MPKKVVDISNTFTVAYMKLLTRPLHLGERCMVRAGAVMTEKEVLEIMVRLPQEEAIPFEHYRREEESKFGSDLPRAHLIRKFIRKCLRELNYTVAEPYEPPSKLGAHNHEEPEP
jgi:hypothetical protein